MPSSTPRILALLATTGACLAAPAVVRAETCTLYQKWKKDAGLGNCSAFPESGYFDVGPTGGTGTFFSRRIPKCKDGTDTGCASTEIKSLDGTRAFYHIDPPFIGTNKWVIAFEGGGACGAMRGDNAATACMTGTRAAADNYGFNGYGVFTGTLDYPEMTTKHAALDAAGQPIYTIPRQKTGRGILSASSTNTYSTHTRVIVNKSSFDRFMGNTTTTAEPYNGDDVQLFFHGRRMITAMLKDLARQNGIIEVGPLCSPWIRLDCEPVDDFALATEVVIVGESGGAGGLVHNMEFIKSAILNRAPNAKVVFLLASRMIPWLEAEANWSASGGIWDDIYSGTSTIYGNPSTTTPDATTTYNQVAFQPGGILRTLVGSWGNPQSIADPFLDAGCKAAHGFGDWRCFDEGHVALYHMDEDVFWFESLADSVHNQSSPLVFVPTADFGGGPIDLTSEGGFLFQRNSWNYSIDRGSRVVYTADQMLLSHPGAGVLGFYMPALNCHTTIFSTAFWSDTLSRTGAGGTSLQGAFSNWSGGVFGGAAIDRAWIEDTLSTEPVTWVTGNYGGGWLAVSATCPP